MFIFIYIAPSKCNPAEGYLVDVILTTDDSSCECKKIDEQNGFAMQSLNAAIINSNSLQENCANPIVITKGFYCSNKGTDKTPRREKTVTKRKNKTPKKSKKEKSLKKDKTKSKSKSKKEKTPKSSQSNNDDTKMLIEALVLCNTCDSFKNVPATSHRSIKYPTAKSIMSRRTRSKYKGSQIIQQAPSLIATGGQYFNVTIIEKGRLGLFCDCNLVDEGSSCGRLIIIQYI